MSYFNPIENEILMKQSQKDFEREANRQRLNQAG